jgi:hypothetical protein
MAINQVATFASMMKVPTSRFNLFYQITVFHRYPCPKSSEKRRSTAPHRVPAVQALVAGAASDGDGAADVARRGIGLHLGALLA